MAGPGDELGAAGRGHLRASHADREQVIGTLKTAFVQGMLVKDEFDLRVGQTLASRTYADLAAVTADLPAGLASAPPPRSDRAPGEQPVLRPGPVIAAASAVYAGVWASVVFLANHSAEAPWAPPLIFGSFLVYLLILIMSVVQMAALRPGKRSADSHRGGPAWAVRHLSACHQPIRDSFPRPIRAAGIPSKRRRWSAPAWYPANDLLVKGVRSSLVEARKPSRRPGRHSSAAAGS